MAESKTEVTGAKSSREIGDWPIFPVEIFEDIIQQIALEEKENSRPTVGYYPDDDEEPTPSETKNLSLVCWTFTRLCRPYIWESINISFESRRPRPSLKRLSDLVKRSPVLATYVTRVSCSFESAFVEANDVSGISVLFGLPNVKEFEIPEEAAGMNQWTLYYGENDEKLAWKAILSHFMARPLSKITISNMWDPPIVQLLSSPALETLQLRACTHAEPLQLSAKTVGPNGFNLKRFVGSDLRNFPLEILSCCPELEELDLVSVHPSDDDDPTAFLLSTTIAPFRRLRKFTTQGFFDCALLTELATVAGLKYFPALKVISITVLDREEIPGVVAFFKYCQSLEEIYFQISRDAALMDPKPLRELILTSKRTLKDIWLDCGVDSLEGAEKIAGQLCDTLEQMRGQNVLEELTTGTDFQCMDSDLLQPPSVKQWQRLNAVLLDNDGADFPHLREVVICLEPFVHPTGRIRPQLEARLKEFFKEPLKGLFATKRFKFMSAINLHMVGMTQHGI
ncbi:hypothetical protein BJ165DRAFT_1524917 [Panaeolus papilionaceus]|nr:hypothetical protein BJ165DRAFT_1524917 [Panaeolus papilionaceus]